MTSESKILMENLESAVKYDFLTEGDIEKINQIIIERMESPNLKLNPDDLERDIGKSCEAGVCPSR